MQKLPFDCKHIRINQPDPTSLQREYTAGFFDKLRFKSAIDANRDVGIAVYVFFLYIGLRDVEAV